MSIGGATSILSLPRQHSHHHHQHHLQGCLDNRELHLSVASERRFFAHRSQRRLGNLGQALPWQQQHQQPSRRSARAAQRDKEPASDPERRFLTLSGRSTASVAATAADTSPRSPQPPMGHQRGRQRQPTADALFLKPPQTPASVTLELRGSLLACEDSGLLLRSFWMPEDNLLNEETKTAKDENAPLYKRRDLQQLTEGGGGRGSGGCVIAGNVPGSLAQVGQNGRPLNLRAAWSDTPELRRQRRLSYHSVRAAGRTPEAGVHLSWRSQMQDPAVKIIDSNSARHLPMTSTKSPRVGPPPSTASSSTELLEASVMSRVRGSSGSARSPLKASAMFHAKRCSRALANRFLAVEGEEQNLPGMLHYDDLLRCLQERQEEQEKQHELSSRPLAAPTVGGAGQEPLPRLERRPAAAVAASKDTEAAPATTTATQAPSTTVTSTAKSSSGKKSKASVPSAGRIATGRSLSKSAPARPAAAKTTSAGRVGGQQATAFLPIVKSLGGGNRPHAAKTAAAAGPQHRASREVTAGKVAAPDAADADVEVDPDAAVAVDEDDEAIAGHQPSNPLPSTPKASTLADATPEGIRVPVMSSAGVDEDFEDDDDGGDIGAARIRATSPASLTSTHVSDNEGGDVGDLSETVDKPTAAD